MIHPRDAEAGGDCGVTQVDQLGFRAGAIIVVLVTSLLGTLFPIITKRSDILRRIVPGEIFEFGKFFGSGVILATAIIHLLGPAVFDELGPTNTVSYGGCISDAWAEYPYSLALCLGSLFATFVIQLLAFRVGMRFLNGLSGPSPACPVNACCEPPSAASPNEAVDTAGILASPTSQNEEQEKAIVPGLTRRNHLGLADEEQGGRDSESVLSAKRWEDSSEEEPAGAQILGVAVLEFGILFHSVIIGMTISLASPDTYTTLFIVIIFHQMFEGLGLGSRLAFLRLPRSWRHVPLLGGLLYALMTPLGMAIGLGARQSLSMTSGTASIVSGVFDSVSAGILLYAGTVELIAHEFIFNPYYYTCSNLRIVFVVGSFAAGAGIMSLLAKWI